MKDSRIGAFGVLALAAVLALRAGALASLSPPSGAVALIVAHGVGREAGAVIVMASTPYVGDVAGAKGRPGAGRPTSAEAGFAALWGLAPLAPAALAAGDGPPLSWRSVRRLL